MLFAITWMDLESVILSDISQGRRNIAWHPLYEESTKKQYKNGLIYKIQRDSQIYERNLWLAERKTGGGIGGVFETDMYTPLCCCCCCW